MASNAGTYFKGNVTTEEYRVGNKRSYVVVIPDGDATKAKNVIQSNEFEDIDSAGALAINGISVVAGGTGLALTLAAPEPGVRKKIYVPTLSSGAVVVTTASGVTYDGTNNTLTLGTAGEYVELVYESATQWKVIANSGGVLSAV